MVKEEKLKEVEEVKQLMEKHRVIGILDMFKIPSKQLQEIRKELRGKAIIKMTKKSILTYAINGTKKKNLKEMEKFIPLQPALILTNVEAFKFYSMVSKLTSKSFAKPGDKVEEEIKVKAGPTGLMPGPVISEFSRVGIVAGVEGGRIAIKKDKVVARPGDTISPELASILKKLKIEPIKIRLNIIALYDDGEIYSKETLELVDIYRKKIEEAFKEALNLSISMEYPTKENIKYLLIKAYQNAKAIERSGGEK